MIIQYMIYTQEWQFAGIRIGHTAVSYTHLFGIEIKLPNGTGQTSGDGSIAVSYTHLDVYKRQEEPSS